MQMITAQKLLSGITNPIMCRNDEDGYMISFEWEKGGFLHGDLVPDKREGELLIKHEDEAWELAKIFAAAMVGQIVNVYVVKSNFTPVTGYEYKQIENR